MAEVDSPFTIKFVSIVIQRIPIFLYRKYRKGGDKKNIRIFTKFTDRRNIEKVRKREGKRKDIYSRMVDR